MDYLTQTKTFLDHFTSVNDPEAKKEFLTKLKIMLLHFKTLPPYKETPLIEEYILARNIFEAEMSYHLERGDEKNFELAYLKIKQFYFDFKYHIYNTRRLFGRSENMLYFCGLYLLHLLSNNRTTEYCTELEQLDIADQNDRYIRISRDLEQCIMEGNYKQIIAMKNEINYNYYKNYLNKFDNTIRYQIARSAENSYESLKTSDAISLLMLNNYQELQAFIKNEISEDSEIQWEITNERLYFRNVNKEKVIIPAKRIISETISLAIELEKII